MFKKYIKINLIIIVIFLLLDGFNAFRFYKLKLNDICFKIRYSLVDSRREKPRKDILVVPIDDTSLNKVSQIWPWPRSTMAKLIDSLSRCNPKVICLDIYIIGKSEPEGDLALTQAIARAKNVIIATFIDSNSQDKIDHLKTLKEVLLAEGIVNKIVDRDFTIRRARSFMRIPSENKIDFALEIYAAAHFWNFPLENITNHFTHISIYDKNRNLLIPINATDSSFRINYRSLSDDFLTIPAWKILDNDFDENSVHNKIVMIGATSSIMHDIHNAPIGFMPGVIINANCLESILNRDFITSAPFYVNLPVTLVLFILVSLILLKLGIVAGLIFVFCCIALFLTGGFYLFLSNYHIDLFSFPMLCVVSFIAINFMKYVMTRIENAQLKELAITDGLTGLYLRRYFDVRIQHEFDRFARYGGIFSLLIMDIDHFKRINDNFGHQQGDSVLKLVANIIKKNVRKSDIAARYGGEEFVVILINTNSEGAFNCAEKIRQAIEQTSFSDLRGGDKVTISIGMATLNSSNAKTITSSEVLIRAADTALYKAKKEGRNRVSVFKDNLNYSGIAND